MQISRVRFLKVLVMAVRDRKLRTESERALWRRVQICQQIMHFGTVLFVVAGLLALVVFPALFDEPTVAAIRAVRGIAVLGWLIVFGSMYFDQSYRGEYLARKEGEHIRKEVRWASAAVVLVAAVPVLAVFLFYPGIGGSQ